MYFLFLLTYSCIEGSENLTHYNLTVIAMALEGESLGRWHAKETQDYMKNNIDKVWDTLRNFQTKAGGQNVLCVHGDAHIGNIVHALHNIVELLVIDVARSLCLRNVPEVMHSGLIFVDLLFLLGGFFHGATVKSLLKDVNTASNEQETHQRMFKTLFSKLETHLPPESSYDTLKQLFGGLKLGLDEVISDEDQRGDQQAHRIYYYNMGKRFDIVKKITNEPMFWNHFGVRVSFHHCLHDYRALV
jgi:hypothetical protein